MCPCFPTFLPWDTFASASRNNPIICSAVNRFRLVLPFFGKLMGVDLICLFLLWTIIISKNLHRVYITTRNQQRKPRQSHQDRQKQWRRHEVACRHLIRKRAFHRGLCYKGWQKMECSSPKSKSQTTRANRGVRLRK